MFNSTLTEDNAFLCPVDGAIMITGSLWLCSFVDSILEYVRVHMLEILLQSGHNHFLG